MRPHLTALLSVSWDGRIVFGEAPDWMERVARWRGEGKPSGGEDAIFVDTSRGSSAAPFFEGPELGGMRRLFQDTEDAGLRVFVSEDGSVAPWVGLGTCAGWGRLAVVDSTQARAGEGRAQVSLRLGAGEGFEPLEMLKALGVDYGVRRVLCVGGGELLGILLRAACMDEIWLTFRPQIFGNKVGETLSGVAGGFFPASVEASLLEMEQLGGECFTRWRLKEAELEA